MGNINIIKSKNKDVQKLFDPAIYIVYWVLQKAGYLCNQIYSDAVLE